MRINKFLSEAGICSRRGADKWIEAGRIKINGVKAELGSKVTDDDVVEVDNKVVKLNTDKGYVYIKLNKPRGITSTTERHIKGNIVDFVGHHERIFHIGRLDKDSEGLILLTNDGDIVNEILRKEGRHEKEYIVTVNKPITDDFVKQMSEGVAILDTVTLPAKVEKLSTKTFRIILTQGLNRQIRRMTEAVGYEVKQLRRIRVMNILVDDLKLGQWKDLTDSEKDELFTMLKYTPKR
ncbi:pseudouridine synthase [Macrococcus armenti]|uniref:pseudouridine synthase n=1 Tax=Macrococcus armenti TaxID=2875764 RepID=UPI001CCE3903|nr:pseudouridine synthase [Macrococcus armenti]UBH15901.1 pseudouridine synthase [Macrococcus armenti]UBH18262.1 pseudouridine synthase [Macrococcus armenti]UBH20527.1 pseudouridine synthase [Macrococcus armenti]